LILTWRSRRDAPERPGTFMCHTKMKFSWTSGAHGEYEDEQLQNLQKRICLIEFLHLGFVFVCQGGKCNK